MNKEIEETIKHCKHLCQQEKKKEREELLKNIEEGIEKEIKDTFKWEKDYKREGQHELAKVCNIQIGVYEEIKTLIKNLIK